MLAAPATWSRSQSSSGSTPYAFSVLLRPRSLVRQLLQYCASPHLFTTISREALNGHLFLFWMHESSIYRCSMLEYRQCLTQCPLPTECPNISVQFRILKTHLKAVKPSSVNTFLFLEGVECHMVNLCQESLVHLTLFTSGSLKRPYGLCQLQLFPSEEEISDIYENNDC